MPVIITLMDLRPPPTILQFAATLVSRNPEDRSREFVISFFVEEHAFSIAERTIPNSGFTGGKFLGKTVVNNPKTGKPYEPSDIFIGTTVEIAGRKFILQEASEEALKTMEAKSDIFARSDLAGIMDRIRAETKGKAPTILVEFQKLDTRRRGRVSLTDVQSVLAKFNIKLDDQEFLTLFRRFQHLDSEFFLYQDFVSGLV